MVDSISSKNMSKLRRILVRNLSGGSTEVSTPVPPTQTKIPFYETTFFEVVVGVLILVVLGGSIAFGIMSLINNQETTQEINEETTVTTETTTGNPNDGRETITIGVSDSETTRSSGNRRSSNTQRTESIESTETVDSRSCVNGVCD